MCVWKDGRVEGRGTRDMCERSEGWKEEEELEMYLGRTEGLKDDEMGKFTFVCFLL